MLNKIRIIFTVIVLSTIFFKTTVAQNNNIYYGGSAAGYYMDCFEMGDPPSMNQVHLNNNIFRGNSGSGYDQDCFAMGDPPVTPPYLINNNIFYGNRGDGADIYCTGLVAMENCFDQITTVTLIDSATQNNNDGSIFMIVSGGTPPYTFSWSNGSTSKDITGLYAGIYFVTITDAAGCIEIDTFEVFEIIPDTGNSVPNIIAAKLHLKLYPNPNSGSFNIEMMSQESGEMQVELFNMVGQSIFVEELKQFNGIYKEQINLTHQMKGIYYVQVVTKYGVVTRKIIYQ